MGIQAAYDWTDTIAVYARINCKCLNAGDTSDYNSSVARSIISSASSSGTNAERTFALILISSSFAGESVRFFMIVARLDVHKFRQ